MRYLYLWLLVFGGWNLSAQVNLVKGPYVLVGTPNSVILRWETDVPVDATVSYGTSPFNLTSVLTSPFPDSVHIFPLTGLTPYTKYYYRIGTTSSTIQGDTNNYFVTSPLPGTPGKYRFWVTGDCGNLSANQLNCKNAYLNYTKGRITKGLLLLGDNAYYSGTDAEYNSGFFGVYQTDIMKKTVLWPAPGNHDYNNGAVTTPNVPYYSIFSMPANADAGGVPSGTKAYYSYDYGNIHFISLDSYGTDLANKKMYDTTSAQAQWLKQDLAANKRLWTIVYWHHPPFSMGSHNSDTELDLVQIRSEFVRILERYKVDLILCGHSHDYERSKLMHGHYGPEATFTASVHHLDSSSALYNGSPNSCPYIKDSVHNKYGTVYVVSGSAGQVGGMQASFPHDAMYYSNATDGGSLVLDIENNRLDLKWLCGDGIIRDQFTIMKEVNRVKTVSVLPDSPVSLSASWPGTYAWSNFSASSAVNIQTSINTDLFVKDSLSCLADTFKVRVLPKSVINGPSRFCATRTEEFEDASTNNPLTWSWSVSPTYGTLIHSPASPKTEISFGNAGVFTVYLVAGNSYGQGMQAAKTVSVDLCDGENEGKLIRPNPNNGQFAIEISEYYTAEMAIYDVLGKEVQRQRINNGITFIEMKAGPGVYYCSVISRSKIVAKGKIVVIK
ncbi:MAG: metallophosphoesterase [Bacteroidetes bacterium]|nr:metallophosphoesterase [Bacteroidota bacterium]